LYRVVDGLVAEARHEIIGPLPGELSA